VRRSAFETFVAGCALVLVLASCAGDEESGDATPAQTKTEARTKAEARSESEAHVTETQSQTEAETEAEGDTTTSPEELEGGAGDEEPARSLALLTGRNGRITPRVVRVPPFISIRIELRSADGRDYGLEFKNDTNTVSIKVSGDLSSVSSTVDGLGPGEALVGRPTGAGTPVRIEATAEPGP
jgi:hypothetical protein